MHVANHEEAHLGQLFLWQEHALPSKGRAEPAIYNSFTFLLGADKLSSDL